jgi:4-oxalocrotonate tautomerase
MRLSPLFFEWQKVRMAGLVRRDHSVLAAIVFRRSGEHRANDLSYDAQYLGAQRSEKVVFVQIALSVGRKPQQKRKLFSTMAKILKESPGLDPKNLAVNLLQASWENWSFGNGEAQYMDL